MSEIKTKIVYSGCGCEAVGDFTDRCPKCTIKELEAAAQAVIDMYYATGNQIDPLIDILYDVLERSDG